MPNRGFSSHGMDVVPSSSNPDELFLYLVNHRAPVDGRDARIVGADSSIEVFKTFVGSRQMVHHATFEDRLIMTPNDVVGSPDGKHFHITNHYGSKAGAVSNNIDVVVSFFHFPGRTGCYLNFYNREVMSYTAKLKMDANWQHHAYTQVTVSQERIMILSMWPVLDLEQ
jgi:hypothetical protein